MPSKGFTLVDLMISITIAFILISIALPNLQALIVRNRLSNITNTFMGALNYVRTEAIRRGQSVTLCKSNDGHACTLGGNRWEMGWIAFVDADRDGRRDISGSIEPLLRAWAPLPEGYSLRPNQNFGNFLRYNPRGEANNIGTFAVCYRNQRIGARAIVITRQRPRLGADSNRNHIPESSSGDIASCF